MSINPVNNQSELYPYCGRSNPRKRVAELRESEFKQITLLPPPRNNFLSSAYEIPRKYAKISNAEAFVFVNPLVSDAGSTEKRAEESGSLLTAGAPPPLSPNFPYESMFLDIREIDCLDSAEVVFEEFRSQSGEVDPAPLSAGATIQNLPQQDPADRVRETKGGSRVLLDPFKTTCEIDSPESLSSVLEKQYRNMTDRTNAVIIYLSRISNKQATKEFTEAVSQNVELDLTFKTILKYGQLLRVTSKSKKDLEVRINDALSRRPLDNDQARNRPLIRLMKGAIGNKFLEETLKELRAAKTKLV